MDLFKKDKNADDISHSQTSRARREARNQKQRKVLIAISLVFILLLCLYLFLIFSQVATVIKGNQTGKHESGQSDTSDTGTPGPSTDIKTVIVSSSEYKSGLLVLVDKNHKYDFSLNKDIENDLVSIPSNSMYYTLCNYYDNSGVVPKYLNKETLEQFESMMKAFNQSTGYNDLQIVSAWRSEADQTAMKANGSSIAPGYSEYHTSNCLGIKIADRVTGDPYKMYGKDGKTEYGAWLDANAHKFGFILTDPAGKTAYFEQTFRYVGVAHAIYMHDHNQTLDQYYKELQTKTSFDGTHFVVTHENTIYETYYVPASGDVTIIQVPNGYTFSYSGDNMGGFIVTYQYTV